MLTFEVVADVAARDGGDDVADSLCGTFTVEELVKALAEVLQAPVLELLRRGGREPIGHALTITIRDKF